MNDPKKRSRDDAGLSSQPRSSVKAPKIGGSNAGPGSSPFIYDTGRQSGGKLGHRGCRKTPSHPANFRPLTQGSRRWRATDLWI
jgi:hypothetical protein